jgi:hypothetical protein
MLFANAHHNAQSWLGFRIETDMAQHRQESNRLMKKGKEQVCSKLSSPLLLCESY